MTADRPLDWELSELALEGSPPAVDSPPVWVWLLPEPLVWEEVLLTEVEDCALEALLLRVRAGS